MNQRQSNSLDIDHSPKSMLFWSVLSILLMAAIVFVWLLSEEAYIWLGMEDALGENLTALFYFVAGVFIIVASSSNIKSGSTLSRESLPLLLGLFFIFVAGEEISWGQRIFGFGTPESMLERNVQGEFNIHNFDFLSGDLMLDQHRILALFVAINGIVLPIGYRFVPSIRRFLNRINFPIIPLSCLGFFALPLIYGRISSSLFPHWAHAEVGELVFSIGFLLFAIAVIKKTNRLESTVRG